MKYKEKIISDLIKLGVRKGDALLVHSSLNSFGHFDHRAEIIVEALLEVLGSYGTLLFPTLSYETVNSKNAFFDIKKTPSCVGGLTEYFRLRGDTTRSMHPTHSVTGIGEGIDYFLKDHYLDSTPAGSNSPFTKLKNVNGKILFLGCSLKPNTTMHAVEELVNPPYLLNGKTIYTIVDAEGKQFKKEYTNHNFRNYEQRYDKIKYVLNDSILKKGNILSAESYLINSVWKMWEVVYKKLIEEPFFFVEKIDNV